MTGHAGQPIVFFDGVCGICNRFVDFLLKRDRRRIYLFSPIQGERAKTVLDPEAIQKNETIFLLDAKGIHQRSTAPIRILTGLGGPWKIFFILYMIPRPIRDFIYKRIARNRYRWFGRKDACRIPTAEERARFLP
ncbi:MAG: DUF393 domain-containing protein [Spirochaetia bacterium]|nr:DUF393 domain-containing protein [Spirochaetia bacterium]